MGIFGSLILSALVGLLVYALGTLFDKTPNNRNAGLAGLIVFVVTFLGTYNGINL